MYSGSINVLPVSDSELCALSKRIYPDLWENSVILTRKIGFLQVSLVTSYQVSFILALLLSKVFL